jgi:hypothetical protein
MARGFGTGVDHTQAGQLKIRSHAHADSPPDEHDQPSEASRAAHPSDVRHDVLRDRSPDASPLFSDALGERWMMNRGGGERERERPAAVTPRALSYAQRANRK